MTKKQIEDEEYEYYLVAYDGTPVPVGKISYDVLKKCEKYTDGSIPRLIKATKEQALEIWAVVQKCNADITKILEENRA